MLESYFISLIYKSDGISRPNELAQSTAVLDPAHHASHADVILEMKHISGSSYVPVLLATAALAVLLALLELPLPVAFATVACTICPAVLKTMLTSEFSAE